MKQSGDITVKFRNATSGSKTLDIAKNIVKSSGKTIQKVVKNRLKG